jgi:serine/threonine-protein kinase HipA
VLPVFYEDMPVGQLDESGPGLSFTYDPGWLKAENKFAISLSMPLRTEPYPAETATPWFANLLPEDQQLEQIGRLLGRSTADVYGLLERMGRETAGALSIGGPEPADRADYRELNDKELAEIIDKLPRRPLLAGEDDVTMSLAGGQAKLAVAVFDDGIHLPLRGAASTHILKPSNDRLYATIENELLCMRLAARLGLPVAPTTMALAQERPYLLVTRYDRKLVAGRRVRRDHQEDFCQALGCYPTAKYEARRGPGFAQIFQVIGKHARREAVDRLTLLRLIIFACCIGDTDRHGKNFSMLLTGDGPRLAPGYDFMTALAYDNITRNLAMKIAGQNRAEYLERRHWERFARDVGFAPAGTIAEVAKLSERIRDEVEAVADELVKEFPADETAVRTFSGMIRERATLVAANSTKGPAAAEARTEEGESAKEG